MTFNGISAYLGSLRTQIDELYRQKRYDDALDRIREYKKEHQRFFSGGPAKELDSLERKIKRNLHFEAFRIRGPFDREVLALRWINSRSETSKTRYLTLHKDQIVKREYVENDRRNSKLRSQSELPCDEAEEQFPSLHFHEVIPRNPAKIVYVDENILEETIQSDNGILVEPDQRRHKPLFALVLSQLDDAYEIIGDL